MVGNSRTGSSDATRGDEMARLVPSEQLLPRRLAIDTSSHLAVAIPDWMIGEGG